ncbi:type I-E CRISPR-associated protein Cas5/CasD [uncultured Candidatus Kuenenia sp.]|jgi:CRISPR system Cascade subunit CasD|uniref:type I-E CRISPR-associated protein Cas5/CasD n=1 Tax=uncultured Candidatus Kuenenia sp. TaxID=1048336 RepID=UPI0025E16B05|nr:type I-E CRISPR-associated protein Cas5/CasD [uncultured Candidatus Kuenenia sp.]
MNTRFMLLWLEAPLQSWGVDSKFGRRDSLPFPTKSGVTGLLLCALGASGEQKELLATLASLRQTVVSYVRTRKTKEEVTIKVDREPLLRDFHMVGSGYDDKNPWETLLIPKKSDGKPAVGGGTKMTYRYYLQDARFAVVLEVPAESAVSFAEALKNPVYDLYLGRKNCVPTDFIYQGTFESEKAALQKAGEVAQEKGSFVEDFQVVDGEQNDDGETMTLNDVPVQFGETKRYRDRRVTVIQK